MVEPLTNTQQQKLAEGLDELKASLEKLLDDTASGAEPVKLKDNQGRLSRMDEMHNQSILKANRNLTQNRLREVMRAIQRMTDGSYGECLECGEPIAYVRLEAYPEASLCIACKAASPEG
jgi:DnaK suppressor protein